MASREAFTAGMTLLFVAFRAEFDGALVALYADRLASRFDDAEWIRVCNQAIDTEKFFPPVAYFSSLPVDVPKWKALPPSADVSSPESARIHIAEAKRLLDQIETRAGRVIPWVRRA